MTVPNTNITSGPFVGTGLLDTYDYDFGITAKTEIRVFETTDLGIETELKVDVDFTLTGIGDDAGGTVTRVAGNLPTNFQWFMRSNIALTQETDLNSQGGFFPEVHEDAFDKLTRLVQQLDDANGRSLVVSESYTGNLPLILPDPEAFKFVRWLSNLSGMENVDLVGSGLLVESDVVEKVNDIFGLINISSPVSGKVYEVLGYFVVFSQSEFRGGGPFTWQADLNKNLANGGTIIDPDNTAGFDGTASTRNAFLAAQGAGVGNGCWVRVDSVPIDPHWFGSIGDGVFLDTVSLQAAEDTGDVVSDKGSQYLVDDTITVNNNMRGVRVKTGSSLTALLRMTNGVSVSGCELTSTLASSTINFFGMNAGDDNCVIEDNVFIGDCGHHIFAEDAKNPTITGNTVKADYTQTISVLLIDVDGFKIDKNIIEEHTGFGIQARFSKNGSITNNTVKQRVFTQARIGVNGLNDYDITPDRTISRFTASVDGVFVDVPSTNEAGGIYTYTLSGTFTGGEVIVLYGFVGLENIQVNSECDSIIIANNNCDGTGDSCIVIGADYHNGILDPNNVDIDDFPTNIIVTGNTSRNASAAGIALNNYDGVTVVGNTARDVGAIDILAFQHGIVVGSGLSKEAVISDNTTYNGQGFTKGCVTFLGSTNMPQNPFRSSVLLSNNIGVDCKDYEFFPESDTLARRTGIDMRGMEFKRGYDKLQDFVDTTYTSTASTDYFINTQVGGTGTAKETGTIHGSLASIKTFPGEHTRITFSKKDKFVDSVIKISWWAKVDSGTSFLRLFYDTTNDDSEPRLGTNITNTDWEPFQATMALGSIDALFIEIGSTSGTGYLTDFEISFVNI
jgi:hypothetical protein